MEFVSEDNQKYSFVGVGLSALKTDIRGTLFKMIIEVGVCMGGQTKMLFVGVRLSAIAKSRGSVNCS